MNRLNENTIIISDNLKWVIDNYGFTCPKNVKLNYMMFVNCICKCFSMTVDQNRMAVNILGDNKNKYFKFNYDGSVQVIK